MTLIVTFSPLLADEGTVTSRMNVTSEKGSNSISFEPDGPLISTDHAVLSISAFSVL